MNNAYIKFYNYIIVINGISKKYVDLLLMTKKDFIDLKHFLAIPRNIAVIPHKNADGDAIGSVLACYHYLKNQGHYVRVVSPNDYPEFLKWLPGSQDVLRFDLQNKQSKRVLNSAELIFLMDFNEMGRVGDDMQHTMETLDTTYVMIDHHQQPSAVAKYLYSDTSICATAQMFYHFLEQIGDVNAISKEIATCMYTGILTDTGSFRFPNTTPTTHRIVAELIEKGADNARIYDSVFDQNTYGRLQLLGQALQNLVVIDAYHTAYITISKAEKLKFDFQKGDTEGIVNYALSIKGIIFGVIFIEDEEQEMIKISFRSKGSFSVNQFSRNHFEGGGHDNAAGGRSRENMEQTLKRFKSILVDYKEKLNESYVTI